MSKRNPNSSCTKCDKKLYRRPNMIEKWPNENFICGDCRAIKSKECPSCKNIFTPKMNKIRFCSKSCAAKSNTKSRNRKRGFKSKTHKNFALLKDTFDFDSCMVENCNYNTCYDIHRVVTGKNGGKYEIGNMFAICPNHHAEVTRKIIDLEVINDSKLRLVDRVVM